MNWYLKAFAELTTEQLYQLLQQREQVFVVEQTCPYLDADGADPQALHLWAAAPSEPVAAYARIFVATTAQPYSRIGRVLTAQTLRKSGLGRELMQRALQVCAEQSPKAPVRLGAQVYLRDFYESYGFTAISAEYLEDGIPHIDMERPPQ